MKKQSLISFLTAIFLIALFSNAINAQKSVDLKYVLNQGDEYNYVIDIDQDVVFETNGQTMALDVLITFQNSTLVDVVTPDSVTLESTINRVKMTQGIFGMTVTYDSDDPATAQNPMAAKIAESMGMVIGKSYTQVMDIRGNVIRMDMGNLTENDDLADNLNSGAQYGVYPDHAVKVGDSWETDIAPVKGKRHENACKIYLAEIDRENSYYSI